MEGEGVTKLVNYFNCQRQQLPRQHKPDSFKLHIEQLQAPSPPFSTITPPPRPNYLSPPRFTDGQTKAPVTFSWLLIFYAKKCCSLSNITYLALLTRNCNRCNSQNFFCPELKASLFTAFSDLSSNQGSSFYVAHSYTSTECLTYTDDDTN